MGFIRIYDVLWYIPSKVLDVNVFLLLCPLCLSNNYTTLAQSNGSTSAYFECSEIEFENIAMRRKA